MFDEIRRALPEPFGWVFSQVFLCLLALVLNAFGADKGLLIFSLIFVTILNGWFWVQE